MANMDFLKSARGRIVDDLLILKAKGTVATSMVGEDPLGTDKYYDTGGGRTRGDVVVNVYAIGTVATAGLQQYTLRLQGSKNSSFTTGVDLVITELGSPVVRNRNGGSSLATEYLGIGRYIVPFTNDLDDTVYRYVRHWVTLGGTVPSIQYECYLSDIIT